MTPEQAIRHLKELKAGSNDSFWALFFDTSRYLVLCGGGGSGKSIFAGRYVLERCTTEPGHRWLVLRKVARTIRHSCFDQLKDVLSPEYIGRVLVAAAQAGQWERVKRFAESADSESIEKLMELAIAEGALDKYL